MTSAAQLYGEGVNDGMTIVLTLLLGQSYGGAQTAPQPLPPELEKWARDALAKLEATHVH